MYSAVIDSPIGKLGIITTESALSGINFLMLDVSLQSAKHPFTKYVVTQLKNYFSDPTFLFDLPLSVTGRPFQKRVWCALQKILVGEVKTYGQLAEVLESGPRAVGNACRCNPIPIIIPCHRVVAKHHLGGYSGETAGEKMRIKQWLIAHENNYSPTRHCAA